MTDDYQNDPSSVVECQPFHHFVASMRSNYGDDTMNNNNPYVWAVAICFFWSVVTFVVSSLTKNYSQTDKLWSIVPFLYTWIFICDTRTLLMAFLATVWGIRLTYNFHRRGGYEWPPWSGDEDYRWKILQRGDYLTILTNPVVWCIFNLTFISFYQHVLLMLIVAPSFVAWSMANNGDCAATNANDNDEYYYDPQLNRFDIIATVLFLFFLLLESIADNQQYTFQIEKYKYKQQQQNPALSEQTLTWKAGEYADGFLQSGLFAIVRKPNYAAEQSIWISFYIFSIASTNGRILINWSIIGCILLMILFLGSGPFTESITVKKYPKYTEYQQSNPLYWPFFSIFFQTKTKTK